jgi:uncharacterized membrane protein YphA (DoxX/SURF4 family)
MLIPVNIFLWVLQIFLAAAFGMAGLLKITQPIDKLAKNMTWVTRYAKPTVRFVGVAEVLGAVGLIVPWATGIAPILTPIAAAALGLTMLLAVIDHLRNSDAKGAPPAAVLLILSVIVAIGRF